MKQLIFAICNKQDKQIPIFSILYMLPVIYTFTMEQKLKKL